MEKRKPSYRSNKAPAQLVLGTAGLGGAWGKIDPQESIDVMLCALENGVERLDTAPAYNIAEELVGKALRQWKGKAPFVSTKVGRLKGEKADDANDNVETEVMERSVSLSLERLGRKQLDLLFLHVPEQVPADDIRRVTDFLTGLKETGKAGKVGFGGTPPQRYWPYVREGVFDVIMGYNNLDACCLDAMSEDVPFMRSQGLTVYQGSPLHMGLLGNRFEAYIENSPDWITAKAVENAKKINRLAIEAGMSLPMLALRYILSVGEVDYLVLGSRNMKQFQQSLADCRDGVLEEDMFDRVTNVLI